MLYASSICRRRVRFPKTILYEVPVYIMVIYTSAQGILPFQATTLNNVPRKCAGRSAACATRLRSERSSRSIALPLSAQREPVTGRRRCMPCACGDSSQPRVSPLTKCTFNDSTDHIPRLEYVDLQILRICHYFMLVWCWPVFCQYWCYCAPLDWS